MKLVCITIHHYGVPGIGAALITNNHISIASKQISYLCFALITELSPYNNYISQGEKSPTYLKENGPVSPLN